MDINAAILAVGEFIWGWPLVLAILGSCVLIMAALDFVQFRYFFHSWRVTFAPSASSAKKTKADMTPFQAFVNALSSSIGNGSIAGIATAIYAGGPGAGFWVFVFGFLAMSLKFAEAYLGTVFVSKGKESVFGGPMLYLKKVPGGTVLSALFTFFFFLMGIIAGNAMQANSVSLGLARTFGIPSSYIAILLFVFVLYILLGGAQRIVRMSDTIVPIKVGLFFTSSFIVMAYHYQTLIPALMLIIESALMPSAIAGGLIGFTVQQALRFGIARTVNSSEAGLGTVAMYFGATGSKEPVKNGFMAMVGTFISANLVCFMIAWMIVASGVWNSGLNSINLTSAAFETVFGALGTWIVTFLSVSFGIGVLVSFSYTARLSWLYLTGGRYLFLYNIFFAAVAFFGAVAKVDIIWNSADVINALVVIVNLYGILWLLPVIRRGIKTYRA